MERVFETLRDESFLGEDDRMLLTILRMRILFFNSLCKDLDCLSTHLVVEGRQIHDASLIANEAIDSILKSKERGVLFKLDREAL